MNWTITLVVVVAIVIGLFALIIWDRGGRNVSRDAIPGLARAALIQFDNGAFYRFNHRGSDVWFSLERLEGSDTSAVLALRIPRTDGLAAVAEQLQKTFGSQGFEWIDEEDNPSLLARVLIPVENIWSRSSGASGNHAVRLLLDALGLNQNARFDLDIGGTMSRRWKNRDVSDL